MSKPEVSEAVRRYVNAAVAHGEATERGEPEVANIEHDEVVRAFHDLEFQQDEGWKALHSLLSHGNPYVRGWSATHMLKTQPAEACRVLEELTNLPGSVGLDAEMVLEEWRNGTLRWA